MNKQNVTLKKAMLEALEKSLGIVTTAAKSVGITRKTHYDWLNKEWYSSKFNIVSEGDLHGKNSIRSKKNVNQIIVNTDFPKKIEYKEYIMPLVKSNKGNIYFKNKTNDSTEVIWYLNYQTLPLLDEITYKMYDRIITNSLKNLKTYSERTKYQNKV